MRWICVIALLCAIAGADTGGRSGGGNWQPSQPTPRIGGGGGGGGGASSSSFPDHSFDTSGRADEGGGWFLLGGFVAMCTFCVVILVVPKVKQRRQWKLDDRASEQRVRARFASMGLVMPGDPGYVPLPSDPRAAPSPGVKPVVFPIAAPVPVERPRALMLRFAIDGHARADIQAGLARSGELGSVAALVLSQRESWLFAGADDGDADATFAQPRYDQRTLSQLAPTAPAANTGLVLVSIYVVANTDLPPVREIPSGVELVAALEAIVALAPAAIVRSSIRWNPSNTELEIVPRSQREPEFIAMRR